MNLGSGMVKMLGCDQYVEDIPAANLLADEMLAAVSGSQGLGGYAGTAAYGGPNGFGGWGTVATPDGVMVWHATSGPNGFSFWTGRGGQGV